MTLEVVGCREPGCDAPASPDGETFIAGIDHDGDPAFLRKWRCAAGHWYHLDPETS